MNVRRFLLSSALLLVSVPAHAGQAPFAAGAPDQGLTQVLQAAVVGLEAGKPYVLALTSNADGTGEVEPLARFVANPAGAQIVNAVGPIRQIVSPATPAPDERRYLAIMTVEDGKPGRPVQLQQPEMTGSSIER
jgi:hypothetical protein